MDLGNISQQHPFAYKICSDFVVYDLDFRSENHIDAKLVAQVLVPVYDAQWPIKLTWETSLLLPDILGFWIK
jgi:hypothetical protein